MANDCFQTKDGPSHLNRGGLVLTREVNESFLIGDDIKVSILFAHDGRARVHVVAPGNVRILRTQLLDQPAETPENDRTTGTGCQASRPTRVNRIDDGEDR